MIGLRLGLALACAAAGTSLGYGQQLEEPFTSAARWSYYLQRTYSPSRLAFLAADTAVDQMMRDPHCWNSEPPAYGLRFARGFERRVVRNSFELAGGLLTGEDLRYRHSQSHTFRARVWNAVLASVTARMPDGSTRPGYTRFFAGAATNLATAHWTRQSIEPGWLMRSAAWSTIGQAQTNLLDEFGPDLRRVGGRIWKRVRR